MLMSKCGGGEAGGADEEEIHVRISGQTDGWTDNGRVDRALLLGWTLQKMTGTQPLPLCLELTLTHLFGDNPSPLNFPMTSKLESREDTPESTT